MTVFNPNNTTHSLNVVPRFYPDNVVVFSLYNEAKQTSEDITHKYKIDNGKLVITFDYTFKEFDKHQLKITQGDDVVYRGKSFATGQETQEYKLSKDKYYY